MKTTSKGEDCGLYLNQPGRKGKRIVAALIVAKIQGTGGRFLGQLDGNAGFYVMENREAIEKTKQCFNNVIRSGSRRRRDSI